MEFPTIKDVKIKETGIGIAIEESKDNVIPAPVARALKEISIAFPAINLKDITSYPLSIATHLVYDLLKATPFILAWLYFNDTDSQFASDNIFI